MPLGQTQQEHILLLGGVDIPQNTAKLQLSWKNGVTQYKLLQANPPQEMAPEDTQVLWNIAQGNPVPPSRQAWVMNVHDEYVYLEPASAEQMGTVLHGLEEDILADGNLNGVDKSSRLAMIDNARARFGDPLQLPQLQLPPQQLALSVFSAPPLEIQGTNARITASLDATGVLKFTISSTGPEPLTPLGIRRAEQVIGQIVAGVENQAPRPYVSQEDNPDGTTRSVPVISINSASLNTWLGQREAEAQPGQRGANPAVLEQVARARANPALTPQRAVIAPIIPLLPVPGPQGAGGVQVYAVDLFDARALNAMEQVVRDKGGDWAWTPGQNVDPDNQEIKIKCGPGPDEQLILKKTTDQATNQVTTQIIAKHSITLATNIANCAKMAEVIAPLKRAPIGAVGVAVFHTGNDAAFMVELTKKMLDKGFGVKLEFAEPDPAPPRDRATVQRAIDQALTAAPVADSQPPKNYKQLFDLQAEQIPEPAREVRFTR